MPGESTWPTQPLPLKPAPFARQLFTHAEITNRSPEAHLAVLEKFTALRPHVPFMPPSLQGTIILPGFDGGAEWGGAATDPDGILYVNANEMAWILTLVDAKTPAFGGPASGPALFTQICAACHGVDRKGNVAQNVPSLENVGQRLKLPDVLALLQTGKGVMPSFAFLSEAQRTAGGVLFIAASRDEHLRAFDRRTDQELWKAKLPAAGYATPAVYSVGDRQFVVVAAGGGKIGTKSGDTYVAFALPK